jgi:hypothetical protein
VIRVETDQGWQTLGADRERGILPDGIAPAWDAWGPASMTFSLARDPNLTHPDLAAATPLEYLPYGAGDEPAWGGYVNDTPAAGEAGITVNARGWQYVLDDDPYVDTYVHENLADWQDVRALPGGFLYNGSGGWTAAGNVTVGTSEIVIARPQGSVMKNAGGHGIYLDLGPLSRRAKTVSVDVVIPAAWTVGYSFYVRATDSPTGAFGDPSTDDGGGPFSSITGTYNVTFATPRRYVLIFYYVPGATATTTTEELARITGIRVFTDDAYRSGSASALKASQVDARALSKVPALSQDTSLLTPTTFAIRAYGGLRTARTARQDLEQINAYHRWIKRVRADRRLEVRPRFGTSTLEVNTRRPGVDWQDTSANSLDDVYNAVTVEGRTGSGTELSVRRLSGDVGLRNVLDRRGRVRSKVLTVTAPTDTATMTAIGDVWLTRYARTPLKGSLTITGPEALRDLANGGWVRPGYAGPRTGEIVLLSNLVDPDTGSHGRPAVMAGASYNPAADAAAIAIDNTREDLEGLLARMGVVAGQGV